MIGLTLRIAFRTVYSNISVILSVVSVDAQWNADAVSLHGYGEQPEQWMTNHAQLQQLIRKFTNKELPIINSEWGQTDIAKGMNKVIMLFHSRH
jgi:hypothetical protein